MIKKILCCIATVLYSFFCFSQERSLNQALTLSYINFIKERVPAWYPQFTQNDFYLLETYNPYGFKFDRKALKKIRHCLKIKSANQNGIAMIRKNYKKNKQYIGYPAISMIGRDTLSIAVSQADYNGEGLAFSDIFTSFFKIYPGKGMFKEISLPSKDKHQIIEKKFESIRTLDFDSIYINALSSCIDSLSEIKIPYSSIYIYEEYFPSWFFCSTDKFKVIRRILVGDKYGKYLKNHNIIIGWPQVCIDNGKISISLRYTYMNIINVVETRKFDKKYKYDCKSGWCNTQ